MREPPRRSHPIFAALYDRMNAIAERKILGAWRRRLLEGLQLPGPLPVRELIAGEAVPRLSGRD